MNADYLTGAALVAYDDALLGKEPTTAARLVAMNAAITTAIKINDEQRAWGMRLREIARMAGVAAIATLVTAFYYREDITAARIENNRLRARLEAQKPILHRLPGESGRLVLCG